MDLRRVDTVEAFVFKVSSAAGTADVRFEYETSFDDSNWDDSDDNSDIVSSTATDYANNKEGWNTVSMPAPLNNYIRILADEIESGSLSDTLVSARLLCRSAI